MHMDVIDLRRFYRTVQGSVVRRLLTSQIRRFWPDVSGLEVAAIGFGPPFARALLDEAASFVAFMPGPQGVVGWPSGGQNLACLVGEQHLPVLDRSFDRILLVHALEPSEMPAHLLDEVWRALKPNGQLLVIVPNRRGAWAYAERTPFGTGPAVQPATTHAPSAPARFRGRRMVPFLIRAAHCLAFLTQTCADVGAGRPAFVASGLGGAGHGRDEGSSGHAWPAAGIAAIAAGAGFDPSAQHAASRRPVNYSVWSICGDKRRHFPPIDLRCRCRP